MADLVSIGFKADASGIKQAGNELDKLSKKGAGTDASVNKLDKSVNQLNKDFGVLDKTTAKISKTQAAANANMSKFGRSSGQAGIQLQQFIGQVHGGQSAMLALSQQSADLGFVLGAPLIGAIVGISASLVGMLVPNLLKSTNAAEDLEEISKKLGATLASTSGDVELLSSKIERLAKQNKSLAELQIAISIRDAEKKIKTSVSAISDVIDDFRDNQFLKNTDSISIIEKVGGDANKFLENVSYNKMNKLSVAIGDVAKKFDLSGESATRYFIAQEMAVNNPSAGNIKAFSDTVAELNKETNYTSKSLVSMGESILPLISSMHEGVNETNFMRQALSDLDGSLNTSSESSDKTSSAIDGVSAGLQMQIIAMRDGEEAAIRFGIAQSLGLANIEKIPKAINDQINEIFKLTEAKKEAAKAEELLKAEQVKASAEQKKQEQSLKNLSLGLAEQIIQLQMTSDEYEIYNAKMIAIANGATPEMITAIVNQVKTIQKLRAELKGDVDLGGNLDNIISQVDNLGGAWSNTSDTIAQAMGDIVSGLDSYSAKMEKITGLEKSLKAERELSTATAEDRLRIDQALADLDDQSTRAQLSGMTQISGAAASLFAEQSKEREALHKMEQVYTAIEIGLALQKAGANALTAITSSFAAPFPVNFAAGAAMIGIMAGLGVFSGSGGGSAPSSAELQASQGTGTVMGGADEKSESIINALEEYNDIGIDQLAQLVGIRNSMSNLASGIENLAVSLVTSSSFGGADVEGLGTTKAYSGNVMNAFFGGERLIDKMLGGTLNSLVDGIFGNFKKTTVKLLDTGIAFDAQTLGDLIANGVIDASYYNVIETTKRSFWGLIKKTGESTEFTDIETAISDEFVAIFGFLGSTVTSAIESLGVDAAASLESFAIDLPNLSFDDMSGEEIQKELEAIFSQQGDLIAEYMLPQIKQFQNMGEGALETLTRVAKEQAYFNDAVDALGLSLGDLSNLMRIDVAQSVLDLMGGLEAFSEATSSYIENFFSDSEKMEMLGSSLSDVFDGLGVPMVTTTDGFRDLVASLDLTTLAGQEMFATLMAVNPAMAEYIEMLDDQEEAIKDLASDAYDDLVLAVEAEKDRVAAALQGAKDIYAAEIERITGVRDTLNETFDALTDNLDDAKSAMTDAFDAQKQQILDASTMRIEGIQQEIDASRTYHDIELDFLSDRKSALNDMISGLGSASSNLRSIAEVDTAALSTDLAAALSAAQGGNFNPAMALGDISALMGDASGFSSAAQMNVSRGVTGFAANELANLVDNQLSVEERTLALLEQQSIDETMRYDAEQSMLNDRIEAENESAEMQIAALDEQLNNLLGINTGVLSIDASIVAFQKAQDELNALDYERQLEMLAEEEEWAMDALDVAEQNSQDQIDKLDDILNTASAQINALYNINTSVLSVQTAIAELQTAVVNAELAQANRDAQIAKQTRKSADSLQQIVIDGVQTEAIA